MHRYAIACATILVTASPAFGQETPLRTAVDGTFAPHALPRLAGGDEGFNIPPPHQNAPVAGNTAVARAAKNNPQLELAYTYSTGLVWATPLRKDSTELRREIENATECMKLDGTIAKMHETWFGIKPPPGSAAVTVFAGYG